MSKFIYQIFNSIPDEVVVMDKDKVIREVNDAFLRNNGLTADEVKGRYCYDLERNIAGQCQYSTTGECSFDVVMSEKKTATRPKTLPTARSMPPVMMTRVIPQARIPKMDACRSASRWVPSL